jgi:hypothetical protein
LLCKNIIVAKSEEVKTGSNLEESCKEGCGSKRAVLPTMMNNHSLRFYFPQSVFVDVGDTTAVGCIITIITTGTAVQVMPWILIVSSIRQ